jgi:DNA-binding MarR family transcriptional regulator
MMSRHPLAFEVFTEVAIIQQLTNAMLLSIMPKRMTLAQFTVLSHFVRRDVKADSPASLANAFQVTRPTMTSTLIRMERAGLVKIVSDPNDGRGKLVSLTAKGSSNYAACVAAAEPLTPKIKTFVSDSDLSSVLPKLRKIRAGLDKMRD